MNKQKTTQTQNSHQTQSLNTPPTTSTHITLKTDESILVIKRDILFQDGTFQGLKLTNIDSYKNLIRAHQEFLPRSLMEIDDTYKQVIPYLIFTHDNRYFLMQRHAKASETRLQNKFSLGIGGHIYQKDIQTDDIYAWAEREFHEEIHYTDSFAKIESIGILNDDSNDVGRVHIGLVLLLHGNSSDIGIKSELASGKLVSLEECEAYGPYLESWSRMVYDYLLIR